jgi:VRR-NUC domain-containing protein
MNESALSKVVIKKARAEGWIVAHFHAAPTQKGHWGTPVAADGKGFPDLVLARERVLFVELKADGKYPGPDQRRWMERLRGAGAEVHVWKPRDLESGLIEELLGDWRQVA